MGLAALVGEAFAESGVLARAADHYRPRDGQTRMALAVAGIIETGGALVVEAGTGVGKTFAYLVPALLSGERVLVSTATKTLQDQLFGRDLPRLVQALGVPVRTALLKGRASYLCVHRLAQARQGAVLPDRVSVAALARVEEWARRTRTGDLAEVTGLDERSPVIPIVTSTRDNCLGSQCPRFADCHVNLARREALAADVVVINHHLFFADLSVRESGMAELLPTVRVVIFDEAHQVNEIGVQFFGNQLSTGQLLDFARDVLATGLRHARGLADWQQLVAALERGARELRLAAGRPGAQGVKLRWSGGAPEGLDGHAWQDALSAVRDACEDAMAALDTVSELSPDFVRLHERAVTLVSRSARFADACAIDSVRWVDVGAQLRLIESPLDIADAVRTRLLGAPQSSDAPQARLEQARSRAWIFTSATLGNDARLRWFTEPCGLEAAQVLRVDSPFDYASQAAVYVPDDFPRPADPAHAAHVAKLAGDAALRLGGRSLVLTTSLRALRAIGELLEQRFAHDGSGGRLEVLVQGQRPKRVLMERFREGAARGLPGCVLVASASFWEGVDLPGDALQLVVIDKLPFPPPGDPLVDARSQRLQQKGRSPFADYSVPEAAVALKQGAGRLIRRETDTGILVVADTRLRSMSYGRKLMDALPPMRRLQSAAEFDEAITRISTRDRPCP